MAGFLWKTRTVALDVKGLAGLALSNNWVKLHWKTIVPWFNCCLIPLGLVGETLVLPSLKAGDTWLALVQFIGRSFNGVPLAVLFKSWFDKYQHAEYELPSPACWDVIVFIP